jgi:hypothetical protein
MLDKGGGLVVMREVGPNWNLLKRRCGDKGKGDS